jgi:hypothetical protein
LLLRSGVAAVVVTTLGAAGVLGASAIRAYGSSHHAARRTAEAQSKTPLVLASEPAPTVVSERAPALNAPAPAPAVASPEANVRSKPPFTPVVPQGQSSLPDGPTAVRADSLVTVSFDAPMIRTRIPAKFERLVRTTLPAVYGRSIDSVLAKIPEGGIARQGDLVSELPTRGIRIPVNAEWTIALYPETRPGHDGPLVVRYRVSVVTKTE